MNVRKKNDTEDVNNLIINVTLERHGETPLQLINGKLTTLMYRHDFLLLLRTHF